MKNTDNGSQHRRNNDAWRYKSNIFWRRDKCYGTENKVTDSNNSDDEYQVITRQEMLENLSDEELKEEMTSRLVDMEFEPNQIEELYKALDAHIKLSVILSYLYPTTTVEEMKSRRKNYLKRKGD